MRLGSETNSLVNHVYAHGTIGQPEPFVGMGVTFLGWTDRSAGTIVEVIGAGSTVKRFYTTNDTAKVVKGSEQDGSAEYEFESNLTGYRMAWAKNRKGRWVNVIQSEKGRWIQTSGSGIRLGAREHYRDPSF